MRDGIESVRAVMLRLVPYDSPTDRVVIEVAKSAPHDIWAMAERRFGSQSPFIGGWSITQARLVIAFRGDGASRFPRSLPVQISLPSGCDLKEKTEDERVIGERYLRRWGLLRDV